MLIYAMFDILTCLHDLWQGFALDMNLSMVHDVVYGIKMSL